MPTAPTAKSLIATTESGTWAFKRINKKLDDRDEALALALQLIEEWDPAVFPHITKVTGWQPSKGATSGAIVAHIGGRDFTESSVVTATLGGTTIAVSSKDHEAQTITLTAATVESIVNAATAGDQLALVIRIDNMLCPPLLLATITS